MITEDYVSFEIAKLLKERGFDSDEVGCYGGFYSERCYESGHGITTQELRQCFDDCFKEDDGTYCLNSDYVEWLGLVSLCEGIESDGIHECRVVFAFDN